MMRLGRKGISGESKGAIAIMVIIGVLFLITFIMSSYAEAGGPPATPEQVIEYYDNLLKGEYAGKKASPTALVVAFFVPLLSTFSILWALIRLLPVFRNQGNRPAAVILAMGLSIYIVPTMSWTIMQVFPPILGVSAIFIGIAVFGISLFIMVSVFFKFGDLRWGAGRGATGPLEDTERIRATRERRAEELRPTPDQEVLLERMRNITGRMRALT